MQIIRLGNVVVVSYLTYGLAIVNYEVTTKANGSRLLREATRLTEAGTYRLHDVDVRASASTAHGPTDVRGANSMKKLAPRGLPTSNPPLLGRNSSSALMRSEPQSPHHYGSESAILTQTRTRRASFFDAVVVDGNDDTYVYDWGGWNDCTPDAVKTQYYCMNTNKIKMKFSGSDTTFEHEIANGDKSVKDLFNAGYLATSFGKANWRAMVGDVCYQAHCNREGFHTIAGDSKCRLGMHMNDDNDCSSCDASIGIGCTRMSAGLKASCCASPTDTCSKLVTATISVEIVLPTCSEGMTSNPSLCTGAGMEEDAAKGDTECSSLTCTPAECCADR